MVNYRFVDANTFAYLFKGLGAKGLELLLRPGTELVVVDQVEIESVAGAAATGECFAYDKDIAVKDFISRNNVRVIRTEESAKIASNPELWTDGGDRAIVEALQMPEFEGANVEVLTNDRGLRTSVSDLGAGTHKPGSQGGLDVIHPLR